MKIQQTRLPLVGVLAILISCNPDDPKPAETHTVPVRLEQADYKREFTFDSNNRLHKIKSSSLLADNTELVTTQQYFYTSAGKFQKCEDDRGHRLEYAYEGDRIIHTDEYMNDVLYSYHDFVYDEKGRLKEIISWLQSDADELFYPYSKGVYVYDDRDNVIHVLDYGFDMEKRIHIPSISFEYSDYDDKQGSLTLFDTYTFNPLVKLRNNNPGKMVVRNGSGNTTSIDVYAYSYNDKGYVTRSTTTTTFVHSGSSGSYYTDYFYDEH